MAFQLTSVPIERRRRAAATAGLIAALLVAAGVLPWVAPAPSVLRVLATIVLVAAVLVALVGWGLLTSIRADQAESRLDAAIAAALADACTSVDACTHDCAACLRS
jgi:cytochrome c-type biogenesis protein CcmH/NrfG